MGKKRITIRTTLSGGKYGNDDLCDCSFDVCMDDLAFKHTAQEHLEQVSGLLTASTVRGLLDKSSLDDQLTELDKRRREELDRRWAAEAENKKLEQKISALEASTARLQGEETD